MARTREQLAERAAHRRQIGRKRQFRRLQGIVVHLTSAIDSSTQLVDPLVAYVVADNVVMTSQGNGEGKSDITQADNANPFTHENPTSMFATGRRGLYSAPERMSIKLINDCPGGISLPGDIQPVDGHSLRTRQPPAVRSRR